MDKTTRERSRSGVTDLNTARTRRVVAGSAGISVLIVGVLVDRLVVTSVPLVDVLYAAFAYLLVVLIRPGMALTRAATSALGFCIAIELLQLTPIPEVLVTALPPTRFVFGTTFALEDLLAYAIGVGGAVTIDALCQLQSARAAASDRSH